MPTPISVQHDWGVEHPCKNKQASCRDYVSAYRVLSTHVERVGEEMRTDSIHLYVVQQWGANDEAAAEHLYLAEPFPPGRMPSGGTIEEYARII
jgi:hypothetical protein